MSNTSVAQVLSFLQPLKVEDCCILSITILVFYDHLLTFGQEVRYVWKSKLSSATIIFYLNRYLILAIALVDLIGFYPYNNVVVKVLLPALVPKQMLIYSFTTAARSLNIYIPFLKSFAFSAVRVFAISGRSWPLALLALAPGLVPCGTYIYSAVKTIYKPTHGMFEDSGCMAISTMSDSINDNGDHHSCVPDCVRYHRYILNMVLYMESPSDDNAAAYDQIRRNTPPARRNSILPAVAFHERVANNLLPNTEYIIRITALLVSRYILNLRHVHSRHGGTPSRTASGEGTGYESAIVSMPSSAPGHASILYGRQRSVYSKHHSYRGDTALRDMKWRHMHSTQSRTSGYTYTPGGWNDVPKAPWKYDEIDWELDGDYDEWWSELSGNEAATAVEMDTMRAPYRPAVGLQVAVEIEVQRDVDSIVEERPHGLEEVKLSRTVDVGYGEP
ncbi:uncharacterized protein FIBRA_00371 [Fibroporia radiculosa]|uniref:DUF6533 domain-containing protein n=1 Tax=Fibroporia radiculosa TaxID=599839 RepID=J4I7W6_9APHY|nr:uncharacterized protein FIBRA_00371 [Fibroporia radiculosa]CCL98376.1 predicted protein [Fibroporia radiculosa]